MTKDKFTGEVVDTLGAIYERGFEAGKKETATWIPVSERLPEKGTYLICTDDGYIASIMYDRDMGWLLSANIIAWMPLPQPYEPQESEDEE